MSRWSAQKAALASSGMLTGSACRACSTTGSRSCSRITAERRARDFIEHAAQFRVLLRGRELVRGRA